jgi:hypothetical protein
MSRIKTTTYILAILVIFTLVANLIAPSVQGQGGVTGFASLRITNFYRAVPRTALELEHNDTVNATGTYQRITSEAAVGTSGGNITVKPAGTILVLVNVGSNTITFTETATLISAGNIALGQNDSATLVSDGTNWTQIAASNN